MYSRQDFKRGQKVYFGRGRGEQTLGVIEKLNPTKAKVRTLESRGVSRERGPGVIWTVPYSLMRPADTDAKPGDVAPPVKREPLTYTPFAGVENLILEALLAVHSNLSPENLTADGELSRSQVSRRYSELQRQLRGLTTALGREVDESEIYAWADSKRKYEQARKTA